MKLRQLLKPILWPFGMYEKMVASFTHNPEDFRLRIVPSWFSQDYVSFEYSGNKGETWKTIYTATRPFLGHLDYNWKWEPLSYKMHTGSTFEYEKKMFSSYQKILDYEAEQQQMMAEGQSSVEKQRQAIADRKKEFWEKINS